MAIESAINVSLYRSKQKSHQMLVRTINVSINDCEIEWIFQ
jgi:hypothetical protein